MTAPRTRLVYLGATAATIGLGLLWRSHLLPLSPFLVKYGGDALWAMMIYFLVRAVAPRLSPVASTGAALGICWTVEFSQLYRAAWIDAARHTRVGHLILGSTFNWPDLPAYAVGVALGAFLQWSASRLSSRRDPS